MSRPEIDIGFNQKKNETDTKHKAYQQEKKKRRKSGVEFEKKKTIDLKS